MEDYHIKKLATALIETEHNIDTIKLVKNKISDEGLKYLLNALANNSTVHTLNMTHN